jgi:hypothetical protein
VLLVKEDAVLQGRIDRLLKLEDLWNGTEYGKDKANENMKASIHNTDNNIIYKIIV